MSLCSFAGASGRYYDYSVLDFKNRAAFMMGGGNYVFTRFSGGALEVLCAGETVRQTRDDDHEGYAEREPKHREERACSPPRQLAPDIAEVEHNPIQLPPVKASLRER